MTFYYRMISHATILHGLIFLIGSRIFSELSVNQEERLTHKITPTPNSAAKAKIIAI